MTTAETLKSQDSYDTDIPYSLSPEECRDLLLNIMRLNAKTHQRQKELVEKMLLAYEE